MLGASLLGVVLSTAPLAPYGDAQELFRLADERITESSGLVASSTVDGVLFTHNDSDATGRFFAVDGRGRTLATYTVPGVTPRDWEDLARGPDEQGRSSLWLADIGDNREVRDRGVLVHRVVEPDVRAASGELTTESPASFRLVYPDRPRDAETLLVHPRTGRLYVVAKSPFGSSGVYAAPERLDPDAPNLLERVAQVSLPLTGTSGGPDLGSVAQLLVTGGDVSPDGSRLVLRTYTDLHEWPVTGDDLAAAFDERPVVTPLPPTRQGEAVGYDRDGTAVLVSSEGVGAPVHRLVRQPGGQPSDGATPPGDGATPPGDGATPPGDGATPPGDGATQDDGGATRDSDLLDRPWAPVAVAGAAALLAIAVLIVGRPWKHRRDRQR